jgi:prephenate dehydrogenase
MNVFAIAMVEELKQSRKETLKSITQLAHQLHQAHVLLEERQEKEAAELLKQALDRCEAITLGL